MFALCCQVAIEFTTASVTAPGMDLLAATLPGETSALMEVAETGLHISNNGTMHYSNIRSRGTSMLLLSCCERATGYKDVTT